MSIIKSAIKKAMHSGNQGAIERAELLKYHCYDNDLMADGYVSPIVLPSARLRELRGTDSVSQFADKCHIPTREMECLLNYEYLEPTPRQLVVISNAYNVSVFWLLGYHARREVVVGSADAALLSALARRNAAESALKDEEGKGWFHDFLRSISLRRINKLNANIASIAARQTAKERLPLEEDELLSIRCHPVFLEHVSGGKEWAICAGEKLVTADKVYSTEDNGNLFLAYLTTDASVTEI